MTEQDLEKAIKLKEELDYERKLLKFALKPSVELNVMLRENVKRRCIQYESCSWR